MATAAVNAAAHQVSTSLPPMPRIRPPRLMKGDPHPNNAPKPPATKTDRIWVQGKWRNPSSNAVKHAQEVQTRQTARALRYRTHGLDIYAYRHIRTNQVIYSLSRTLQNNQVLSQLIFHGKKTVPAAVRRDMWTPYFSVHFPTNPAGAYAGLSAYQKLRELSMQRQLSPPESLITATEEDVAIGKSKLGDPLELDELERSEDFRKKEKLARKLPHAGQILPKQLRAKRLMDQKATSVADIAFVLDWISSGPTPLDKMISIKTDRLARHKDRSRKARTRINALSKEVEEKEKEIEIHAEMALRRTPIKDEPKLSILQVDPKALEQLAMEHHAHLQAQGATLAVLDKHIKIAKAERLFESSNLVDWKTLDTEEHKQRQALSKKAEHEAIKAWYAEKHDSADENSPTMWTYVKGKRDAALQRFDENAKERTRSVALAKAASEAEAEFEKLKITATTESGSLEDLVAKKQERALKYLDRLEAERAEQAARIEKARAELLKPTNETPVWTDSWDIKMYWSDLQDGTFAGNWPQNVTHGVLEPYGFSKRGGIIRIQAVDEADETRPQQTVFKERRGKTANKSVHVFGGGLQEGWLPELMLNGPRQPLVKKPFEFVDDEAPKEVVTTGSVSGIGQVAETGQDPESWESDRPVEFPPPVSKGALASIRDRVRGLFGR